MSTDKTTQPSPPVEDSDCEGRKQAESSATFTVVGKGVLVCGLEALTQFLLVLPVEGNELCDQFKAIGEARRGAVRTRGLDSRSF